MSVFPGAIPPVGSASASDTLAAAGHTALHNSHSNEARAIATKVGTGASTPASGLLLRGNGAGTSAWAQINQASDVTGVLPQANGGTGTTLATGTGKAVYDTSPTISGASLTIPKINTSINDTNNNEVIKTPATASAVNEVTVTNAATGNNPKISATGDDTNVGLNLATKGAGALQINGLQLGTISASSNLGSRTQSLAPSGGASTAYSANNPTLTLTPGKYLLVATASSKVVTAAQDSSFNAVIYSDTDNAEVAASGTSSTGGTVTIWPSYSVHAIVTPAVSTIYSGRVSQTFGTAAAYTFVNSTLIAIPLPA